MSNSIEPKYAGESNFKKKNHYRLKDGDFVARIVPAMSKYTNEPGGWIKYHATVWGYKNTEGKPRVFESPEVKRDGVVEVACPATNRINELKEKLEKFKAEGNQAMVAELTKLIGFGGVYNVDKNYHMNVILLDGSIGELKIRHKAKQDLDREIEKLRNDGVSPISEDDGRFFVFTRTGSGNQTGFNVSTYTQKVTLPNGKTAHEEVVHKITPEMWNRLNNEAFDLNNLFPKLTPQEVEQIVRESDLRTGKSGACDRFFDDRWKAEKAKRSANQDTSSRTTTRDAQGTTTNTNTVSDQLGKLVSATSGATSHGVGKAITGSGSLPPGAVQLSTKTQAQSIDEMPDDEFFKGLGVDLNNS